jgi:hypothetical protein
LRDTAQKVIVKPTLSPPFARYFHSIMSKGVKLLKYSEKNEFSHGMSRQGLSKYYPIVFEGENAKFWQFPLPSTFSNNRLYDPRGS